MTLPHDLRPLSRARGGIAELRLVHAGRWLYLKPFIASRTAFDRMDKRVSEDVETGPLDEADIRSILFGIMLAMFLAALDQTIVATAMPTMGRELGDVEHLSWVVTSYLLSATAVTPLYGKLSDIHGRRVTLLTGIVIFILGSVACALANSMALLIVARSVQGLGGGGLIAMAQTIIGDMIPPKRRGRYQVYIASVFVASSLLGPVLGGVIAERLHWSVIFWINVPLGLIAFAMTSAALRRLPRHDRPHRLDFPGAILMAGASVALLLALSWGGVRHPWSSPPILGLFALSALLWTGFGLRLRFAAEPLIPLDILANPVVRWGTIAASCGMGTFIGLTIVLPLYFETVAGFSAASSGLGLLALTLGTVFGAQSAGRAMASLTHYKRVPVAGLLVAMAGSAVLVGYAHRLDFWQFEATLFLISLGFGTLLPVSTVSIQNAVPLHRLGTATAVMNFFRQLGGAFIVAIMGAIIVGGVGAAGVGVSAEALRPGAVDRETMAQVFRLVFAAAFAGFGIAFLALLAMKEVPLRETVATAGD